MGAAQMRHLRMSQVKLCNVNDISVHTHDFWSFRTPEKLQWKIIERWWNATGKKVYCLKDPRTKIFSAAQQDN